MSTNTSERISANTIYADSGNISAINSNSITNSGALSTGTLTATDSVQIKGNLAVNSNVIINGTVRLGGISFGDVAIYSDEQDFTILGDMTVNGSAKFSYNTLIGASKFDDHAEGLITANNIRATNRLIVGDSAFKVEASSRKLLADTFTAYLAGVISDTANIATGNIETLKANEATISTADITDATAIKLYAKTLYADNFAVNSEFTSKDLRVDGSGIIAGGLTVNGSNRDEGALVINNGSAIFNNGIKVYSQNGVIAQTMSIIGTSDTTGTDDSEEDAGKSAFITTTGVRSLFMGNVTVQDSTMTLDNSPLLAETVIVSRISTATENSNELRILKSGDDWAAYLDEQISYSAIINEDEESYITAGEIESRGAKKYNPSEINYKTPKMSKKAIKAAEALKNARTGYREAMTKAFTFNPGKVKYRIDADGNVLVKNTVTEKLRASSISAHDITVDTFNTNHLRVDNLSVSGTVTAESGAAVGGSTQVNGNVYNYANNTLKDVATINFNDRSSANFEAGTRLNVKTGASLVTTDGSEVSLHGLVEIDMANLILFDSRTGKKYKFLIRDADVEEADEEGDIVIEFGKHDVEEQEPVAGSTSNIRKLNDDLTEFAARLKRI